MTINLMKRIDYWVGIPACFFLTLVDYILRLIPSKASTGTPPQKILFIKPSEAGGIILSYPLMRQVQGNYPNAEMFFLTFESNREILGVLNVIKDENVLTIRDKSFLPFIADTAKVLFKIWKERVDIVFDLEFFSRFTAVLTYLSGATQRVGFYRYTHEGLYRGRLLTHNIPYNPHLHVSKSFFSMNQALDQPRKNIPQFEESFNERGLELPQFLPTDEQTEKMKNRLNELGVEKGARLFLVNPGEGRIPLREWPLNHFIALSQKLLKQKDVIIILVGATENSKGAEELLCKELEDQRCINLNGKTSIEELLTLCAMAEALIANDSGLAHIVSLTQLKQFILFGPESPRIFSPFGDRVYTLYSNYLCSPCLSAHNHRTSACTSNRCLQLISPQEVYDLISEKITLLSAGKN